MGLAHGGGLNRAARDHGISVARWLDLSTGISPWSWPVPAVPERVWQRLPEADDGLVEIARGWCGAPETIGCLPVAGSQAAIQALPTLRAPCRVGVPAPGYAEHGWWWAQHGHEVVPVPLDAVEAQLDALDVLVWIHPNNPAGDAVPRERLLAWRDALAARGGWLVVDEAFVDPSTAVPVAPDAGEGLVVLRSLGKFFGLAGLRAGVVLGEAALCARLETALGPWALSHPARWIMARALADRDWQAAQRQRLRAAAEALDPVLARHGLAPQGASALMRYCPLPSATAVDALFDALAREAVLVRRFEAPPALRFGLAPDEAALEQLDRALTRAVAPNPKESC